MSGVAGTQRRDAPLDPWGRYYTPDDVAQRCVDALLVEDPEVVLEPSAGGGAFVRAVRRRWSGAVIDVVEPDQEAPIWREKPWYLDAWQCCRLEDRCRGRTGDGGPDLIVGNPPYSHAEEHVRLALSEVRLGGTVGMLLRLGVLGGVGRRERLWSVHPPSRVLVLSRRPAFVGPGGTGRTDASEYAWIEWIRGYQGETRLGWLP